MADLKWNANVEKAIKQGSASALTKLGIMLVRRTKEIMRSTPVRKANVFRLKRDSEGQIMHTKRGKRRYKTIKVRLSSPAGYPPMVQTGRLLNSISYELEKENLILTVGTNVYYAPYLEFGTKRMQARPFLRPMYDSAKKDIIPFIQNEINKRITNGS